MTAINVLPADSRLNNLKKQCAVLTPNLTFDIGSTENKNNNSSSESEGGSSSEGENEPPSGSEVEVAAGGGGSGSRLPTITLPPLVITAPRYTPPRTFYIPRIPFIPRFPSSIPRVPPGHGPSGFSGGSGSTGRGSSSISVYSPDRPISGIEEYLECFNTSKKATLTIYVEEPAPGTGKTHYYGNPGHTFVQIKQDNNTSVYGFYPEENFVKPLIDNSSDAVLGENSGHTYSVSISKTINATQLQKIINYSTNYPKTYNLNTYNCTDFAIHVGNLGGLGLPDANGSWPGGIGSNPGTLGQYLRNRGHRQGQSINTYNSASAPSTRKGCD